MRRWLVRIAVGLGVLLGLGAAGLMCERVGERGRYVSAFSTYGAGPEGTRGLYLLADRMGARPQRWAEDLGRLPPGGMLVALGTCEEWMRRPIGRIERQNLRRWVQNGGVLLVAGVPSYIDKRFAISIVADPKQCRPRDRIIQLLEQAEERAERRERDEEPDEEPADLDGLPRELVEDPRGTVGELTEEERLPAAHAATGMAPPILGMRAVGLRSALRVQVRDEGETILRLDDGKVVGARMRLGRGTVIALASASPFVNRDLADQGGGVLFARIVREYAPRGPILFDEYHLGIGERRSTMRYLRQVGATAIVVQLLILVALVLWRGGARFGAARTDPPPEPAGTASYVEGVATLYEKARDPLGVGRIVVRRALERIARFHHFESAEPNRLAERLEQRGRPDAAKAVRALREFLESPSPPRLLTRLPPEVDELVAKATKE